MVVFFFETKEEKGKIMYDKDWADELRRDMHHIHSSPKESLRSLIKLAAVYAGVMLSVGGATMALSFVSATYKPNKTIQRVGTQNQPNTTDTLAMKQYANKQNQIKQIRRTNVINQK